MNVSLRTIVDNLRQDKLYLFGAIYVLVFMLAAAVINYFTWTPDIVIVGEVTNLFWLLWISLYVPSFIFVWFSDFSLTEFGIALNKKVMIFVALTIVSSAWFYFQNPEIWLQLSWSSSLAEAFARTGEELLFRGFVYALILRLFKEAKKPHLWAIILSSVLFVLPHTQVFLPEHQTPVFQLLLLALIFAYFRHKTGSILLSITFHVLIKSDLVGVLFSWGIYLFFLLWSYATNDLTKPRQAIT
ncbi:CPBP family intramembrane glutamic endopeptidase [Candidatus Leptofilum sp.]|uniref:CPBP family intramembrane glutamic endopeptidase n=1 Tax=Candidatus Leptofilum sp. TaxID=3241576 RepID=UPI003B5CF346